MGCSIRRIIQFSEAMQYSKVQIYNIDNQDISLTCMYSWSVDSICWTAWADVNTYNRICKDLEGDFYLRVLFIGSLGGVSINGLYTDCYSICLDSSAMFLTDFCGEVNIFKPYNNLECALELQQQLANTVVCIFGIPVYYFKVDPDEDAIDYTFKEYFLHHVSSCKQLKLMIPDGQLPSSNPRLTEFDFDWQVDWETELSKTQFAAAFGDNAYPRSGDFIYIPMMKRMWEVNAAYDEKNEGLMWRSTTWKLALVKYGDATNVAGNGFDDIIDGWVQMYETTFDALEKNERDAVGSAAVSGPMAAKVMVTNMYNIYMEDAIRKQISIDTMEVIEKTYNHRSNMISRNIYKPKDITSGVTYQKGICGESGTIMMIIETPGIMNVEEHDIIRFGEVSLRVKYVDNKFLLCFNNLSQELEPFKSYMVMIKWNRDTFTSELCIYNYVHQQGVSEYKLRPEMYWFDFENPVCELVGDYNNDFIMKTQYECGIYPYPFYMTNIKLYNKYLDNITCYKESVKYTTNHENNVINDLARPLRMERHGYVVK